MIGQTSVLGKRDEPEMSGATLTDGSAPVGDCQGRRAESSVSETLFQASLAGASIPALSLARHPEQSDSISFSVLDALIILLRNPPGGW